MNIYVLSSQKLNTQLATELQQKKKGKVLAYHCDLSKEQEITAVAQRVLSDFGRVDILISEFASTLN